MRRLDLQFIGMSAVQPPDHWLAQSKIALDGVTMPLGHSMVPAVQTSRGASAVTSDVVVVPFTLNVTVPGASGAPFDQCSTITV